MIGIITINDKNNIGNRLQNYAVYKFLSTYDDTKNIIRHYSCEDKKKYTITHTLFRNLKKMVKSFIYPIYSYNLRLRNKNFEMFEKNIISGETLTYKTNYDELNKHYNFFVVGSDQVWNPNFLGNGMYINMLGFATSNKKIALSPSVGCNALNEEQRKEFAKYLSDFRFLSCREEQGSKLIEEITNKNCTTLIDPTLYLSKQEWESLGKKPKFHKENDKYILMYFLGGLSQEDKKIVKNIAIKHNLKIIDLLNKRSKYYCSGPSEFIYLIQHAELVLTDSFHGSIFSFIFNRPFRIFERNGYGREMNSRIINLIRILNLDNTILINKNSDLSNLFVTNYDYDKLALERMRYKEYFENAYNTLKSE